MTRWFKSTPVPSPIRKLSKKRSMTEPGAAQASFRVVRITVLSRVAALRRTSSSLGSSSSRDWKESNEGRMREKMEEEEEGGTASRESRDL